MKRQLDLLRAAFDRGESLTVLEAIHRYGVYALSQRVGQLIVEGYPIKKDWYHTLAGKKVRRYSKARTEFQPELTLDDRNSHVAP